MDDLEIELRNTCGSLIPVGQIKTEPDGFRWFVSNEPVGSRLTAFDLWQNILDLSTPRNLWPVLVEVDADVNILLSKNIDTLLGLNLARVTEDWLAEKRWKPTGASNRITSGFRGRDLRSKSDPHMEMILVVVPSYSALGPLLRLGPVNFPLFYIAELIAAYHGAISDIGTGQVSLCFQSCPSRRERDLIHEDLARMGFDPEDFAMDGDQLPYLRMRAYD